MARSRKTTPCSRKTFTAKSSFRELSHTGSLMLSHAQLALPPCACCALNSQVEQGRHSNWHGMSSKLAAVCVLTVLLPSYHGKLTCFCLSPPERLHLGEKGSLCKQEKILCIAVQPLLPHLWSTCQHHCRLAS